MRLLLIVAVVVLLWALLKRDHRPEPTRDSRPPSPPPQPEMVSCAHCGVYLPAGEALTDPAQRVYCSAAHRDAGPAS